MKRLKKFVLLSMIIAISVTFSACSFDFIKETFSNDDEYAKNPTTNIATTEQLFNEDEVLTQLLEVREKIREFNVYIETHLYDIGYWYQRAYETTNLGSGSIIGTNQANTIVYVLTNYHVVSNYNSYTESTYYHCDYTIQTLNGKSYVGTFVSGSEEDDMAILSFRNTNGTTFSVANLTERKDKALAKDEFLLAVGNPSGVKNIVTYGKYLGNTNISNVSYEVIHHNALINPGNSGGALTDIQGNFVGMNTWGTDKDDEDNYAIPLSKILEFIQLTQTNISSFPTIIKGEEE